jgi:histidinol-phosphate/aromatic aminotransferase/cobyric acid decarboxylase-like protein
MARVFAAMNALNPIAVHLTRDLDADVDALLDAGADLLYLCTPNNPTGAELRAGTVRSILERFPGPVVIDEAYAEFAEQSFVREAVSSGHAVVLRTFSKAWGLAGLRVGYAVGPSDLVAAIETIRAPFKLNGLGERAAVAALREDVAWMRKGVADTADLRDRFSQALGRAGFAPISSSTNFVLVPVPNAAAAAAAILARGVAVRPFTGLPVVGDAVRVSIGPWEALRRVVDALAERRA